MNTNIILFLLCLSPTITLATIYQWQDAQGETHYGQEPPADVKAIELHPKVAPATPSKQEQSEKQNGTEKKKEETNIVAPLDPKTIAAMKTNCERAKKFLEELESKPRIRLQTADGNVTALSEDQRTQEIDKTKEAMKKNCIENK